MSGGLPLAISQLPTLSSVIGTEIIPLTQNGVTGSVSPFVLMQGSITNATQIVNPLSSYLFPMVASGTYRSISLAQIADYDNRYTAGGTANALTITTTPAYTSLTDGMQFCIRVASNNTGSATLQVNSIAAVTIKTLIAGTVQTLLGNELVAGTDAVLVWDATANAAVLLNPGPSMFTVTGTATGITGSPTCNLKVLIQNNLCSLMVGSGLSGTSNATTFTVTGLPTICAPNSTVSFLSYAEDNGTGTAATFGFTASSATIFISKGNGYGAGTGTGWTASGAKAWPSNGGAGTSPLNITYNLVQ